MLKKQPTINTTRLLKGLCFWLTGLWVLTAIEPFDRKDWLLENLLVFIAGFGLLVTYSRFKFSNLNYCLITVFLSIHLVGAHYTYAETPFGFWLQELFSFSRNHYDRLVHFGFGFLIASGLQELLLRLSNIKISWSYAMSISIILAVSAIYEVIEAIVAILVSPELGAAYLGTQGDVWDPQKDTFLAGLGACLSMLIAARWKRYRQYKLNQ